MSPGDSRDLVAAYQLAKQGDPDAAEYLFDYFYPRFKAIVRRQLARRIRTIADDDDLIQDAWLSLLKAPPATFALPQQVEKYLETTLTNRVREINRMYLKFERHNLEREKHLEHLPEPRPAPRYAELEITDGQWQAVLSRVTRMQRVVLLLLRRGESYPTIAAQLGWHPDSLRRIFRRLIDEHLAVLVS